MDLTLSPSEEAFRDELRAWLEANHPGEPPGGRRARRSSSAARWQRKLHEAGWAGISWPKEYGGRGATLIEQAIFSEEMVRANAPAPANILGLAMGGPGRDHARHRGPEEALPRADPLRRGDLVPGLLGARGRLGPRLAEDARREEATASGSSPGQKVWTTYAHVAKWCMLVARTDPDAPKHQGLTYFIMDMEQDGRRGQAARADHGRGRVQRDLHGRGPHPRGERDRRGRQRLDRRDHDAHERARGHRVRVPGAAPDRSCAS